MEILHVFFYQTCSYGLCYFAFIEKIDGTLVLREISGNDYRKVASRRLEALI